VTTPEVSVVVATRDRAARLNALLDSLREQTLSRDRFELVVVDDGSADATASLLEAAQRSGDLDMRVIRLDHSHGPAGARNTGWRATRSPLVAFTDDDCVATPGWLEAGLLAFTAQPEAVIQGRVEINPAEAPKANPFTHTMQVHDAGGGYPTCNMFYGRALLDRLDGFDEGYRTPVAEDTDLAARAFEAGATLRFVPEATIYHGVLRHGAIKELRGATRWTPVVQCFKRHPELRSELIDGVFFRHNHWAFFRFALALALPRRLEALRLALAAPYVARVTSGRRWPLIAPYLIAFDALQVLGILRGAVRHRTFML
jgi:glycosyltransferase involved in cell wall biosynthesis